MRNIEPYWSLVKICNNITKYIEYYNKLQPGSYVSDDYTVAMHLSYLNAKLSRYVQALKVLNDNEMGVK